MAFRDDREALRQRAESLKHQLDATERELAEKRQRAEDADRLQRELHEARARIDRLEGRRPAGQGKASLAIGAGVLAALAVTGVGFLMVSVRRAVPVSGRSDGELAAPPAPPAPAENAAAPAGRALETSWSGKVRRADGMKLAAGAPCRVKATLRTGAEAPTVDIECGGKFLHRSSDALEGTSSTSFAHTELPAPEAGMTWHSLIYQDQGARTGARTQASVNSPERAASAWREGAPAFRVDIDLDELSSPGAALDPAHTEAALPFTERLQRKGKVAAVTGEAPVAAGASCQVSLVPVWGKPSCRAVVRCGDATLYGAGNSGYLDCEVAGGKPVRARDTVQDNDPAADLDLVAGTATVDDQTQPRKYTATLTLSP
ncbi:MAG: hypothetical protein WKG00_23380 [Polyangiaceae bacterium]